MKHLRALFCVVFVIALLLPPAGVFAQGSPDAPIQVEPNPTPAPQGWNPLPDPNPPPLPPAAPIQLVAPAAVRTPPSVSPLGREVTLTVGAADNFQLTVNTGDPRLRKTDIMFTFDLTGSMIDEIAQAKAAALVMAQSIRDLLPDSRFGVASFMDYPGAYTYTGYADTYGTAPDVPWRLNQSPTADMGVFTTVVNGLTLGNGADSPEDYTRVLFELGEVNNIGWRKNAKKIVVLFGDDATHDLDFAGFNFGGDPGLNAIAEESAPGVPGGDDLNFETVVSSLNAKHIAVFGIDSGNTPRSAATFQGMSTGFAGAAGTKGLYRLLPNAGDLPQAVVDLVNAEAQAIDNLTLEVTPGYTDWVTWTPPSMADVPPETAQIFNVTVSPPGPPAVVTPGYHVIGIQAVADDVILGVTTMFVSVPSSSTTPVNSLCFTPHQTTPPCFLPSPNGFAVPILPVFTAQPDWDKFKQLFNVSQVEYANGTHILAADQYFNTSYHVATNMSFGLAGLSLINFRALPQPNWGSFGMSATANLFGATDSLGEFNNVKKHIDYAVGTRHNYENAANAVFFCANYNTPARWYEFIRSKLQNGDPTVVTLSYMEGANKKQISLAPYGVDPAQTTVAVYDPAFPANAGYRLKFDLVNNELSYILVSDFDPTVVIATWTQIQGAPGCKLFVTPLDIYLHQGVPPWQVVPVSAAALTAAAAPAVTTGMAVAADDEVQIYSVRGDATLLVEDDSGRRFGWDGETFQNNIPGAVFLGQEGTAAVGPGDFLLPGGFQYKVWLIGLNTGTATLMTWIGSAFVQVADVAVTPGSWTAVDVSLDGSTVAVSGASAPTTADITINHLLDGEDRTATADAVQVQTGQTVQMTYTVGAAPVGGFAAAADGVDKFTVDSIGGPATVYNLSLQRRGDAGYTVFGTPGVTLDANSTQALSIGDWTNLGEVSLAVDQGRDGTVDNFINAANVSTPTSIGVSAAPASVAVGGNETEVMVAVYDQFGAYAPDGTAVTLSTTAGALQSTSGATVGGLVTAKLRSGTQAGQAVVTASAGAVTGQGTVVFAPAAAASLSAVAAPASLLADGTSTGRIGMRVVDSFGNPVPGARVSFQTSLGAIGAAAKTNANGRANATLTSALKVGTAIVTATSESLVQTVTVPFIGSAIRGALFADLNRNGVQDSGEPPLRGVRVAAVGTTADVRGAARSGADGAYQIANLPLTSYTVTATVSAGLRFTTRRSYEVSVGSEGVDMPAIGGAWTLYLPQVKRQ